MCGEKIECQFCKQTFNRRTNLADHAISKMSPIVHNNKTIKKTSLKIFKHYKLKPSFSIIKDEKTKDKVGVGDKPPPPSFNNLIKFDPI